MQFTTGKVESPFHYDRDSLVDAWSRIHSIDQEPLPSAENLERASGVNAEDAGALSQTLLAAWVDFHNGDFQGAWEKGKAAGAAGGYVTGLALNSYGTYLAPEKDRADIFLQAANDARQAAESCPDSVNIEYAHALNIGRYSETVSITKAITSGAALTFKKSLDTCLTIQPGHVPSLLAQGALYAQVIDAVGELAARVSFGATRKKVFAVYEKALDAKTLDAKTPPVVYLEYAKNIRLLDSKKQSQVKGLLEQALNAPVLDPLDVFDQREASQLLKSL